LNEDDDIRAWLLANQAQDKDPLDLLILESRQDEGEDPGQTPEPAGGTYPFFDQDIWELGGDEDLFRERSGKDDDSGDEDGGVDEDEDQSVGGGVEEEFVEAPGTSPIILDDEENVVSFETQPAFSEQHDKNSKINYTHRPNKWTPAELGVRPIHRVLRTPPLMNLGLRPRRQHQARQPPLANPRLRPWYPEAVPPIDNVPL
jgi:hypothetical protein